MNSSIRNVFVAISFLVLPAQALAHDPDTPNCNALDAGTDDHIQIDRDMDFDNGELVFRRDGDDHVVITEDRELFIDGERIELNDRGRELVGQYYDTVEDVFDEAMDIAGDAAGLGVSAALQALAAVFSGEDEMEAFEARIEEKAREFERQADAMCARLRVIEDIEIELQEIVPAFEPQMFVQERI